MTEEFQRARIVKDPPAQQQQGVESDLKNGKIYRITYSMGGLDQRRVTRSVAMFDGHSERRDWRGDPVACLDFSLPQGRPLSLLASQLIDLRPAEMNERGQWVLQMRPKHRVRRMPQSA